MRLCTPAFLSAALLAICVMPVLGKDKGDTVADVLAARTVPLRVDSATYQLGGHKERHKLRPKEGETLGRLVKNLTPTTWPKPPPPSLAPFPDEIEIYGTLGTRKVHLRLIVTGSRQNLADDVESRVYVVPESQVDALDAMLTPTERAQNSLLK